MRVAVLVLSVALLVVAGASASTPRAVRFTPLLHAERQTNVKFPSGNVPPVAGAAIVSRTANEASGLNFLLPQAARAVVDRVNFNRRIAIAVYLTTPTAGYQVTVTHVSLARIGKVKEWCVRATVASPPASRPATGYIWSQTHLVTVAAINPSVGLTNTTRAWVLRDQHGKVMSVSHSYAMLPGERIRRTGVARGCPA